MPSVVQISRQAPKMVLRLPRRSDACASRGISAAKSPGRPAGHRRWPRKSKFDKGKPADARRAQERPRVPSGPYVGTEPLTVLVWK